MTKRRPGRPPGQTNPNAGRPATSLRSLDISAIGVELSEPCEFSATVTIHACGACGAVWWEGYRVAAKALAERDEPDEQGFHWPVLARVDVGGRPEKHLKSCPYGDSQREEA